MLKQPKVSVIIAVWNAENYLDRCMESMLNQTYKNIELILCDDCSSDNSLKMAYDYSKKDKRIKVLKNDNNLRSAATRNKCIKEAKGKYLLIQDVDDYSDLTRIEKQVDFLEKHPEYAYVSSSIYRVDDEGIWGEYTPWASSPKNRDFLWGLPYVHPATMFRTDVINKINGYRVAKETDRTEDFDLFLRLHMNGYYGFNLPEKLLYYNENEGTYLRRKYKYRIDEFKVRLSAYRKLKLMPIGLFFAIKPLIVGLIPRKIQYKLRKKVTKKQLRVLQVISKPQLGGVETMLMNIYRNIDREKIQFDFTNHEKSKGSYEDEILSLGGQIKYIKPIREIGAIRYVWQIRKLVKTNKYKIVHSHISINNSLVLIGAFLGGAKIRISHAHTTTTEKPDTIKYRLVTSIMKFFNKRFANKYCACGNLAAEFLYGKKLLNKGKVEIIHNALDIDRFKEYYGKKLTIRREEKLPTDKIIIGHIGRFAGSVKNHRFIFEIIAKMQKGKLLDKYLFVFVGEGEDISKYKSYVKEHKLEKNVLFYGTTFNVPRLLSAFDFLILPSLYEGLPVVIVESQAAGINSIISKNITNEVDLGLDLVKYLSIDNSNIDDWINAFGQNPKKPDYDKIANKLTEKGYDIKESVNVIYKLYGVDNYDTNK